MKLDYCSLFSKKNFYILFAIVLVLKIALICGMFYKDPGLLISPDSTDYINFAKQFVSQGLLIPDVTTSPAGLNEIGPGYPLLMSFFYLFIDSILLQVIINVVMGHLISFFAYKIGLLLFKNHVLSFIAAAAVMLNPTIVFYSRVVLKESITGFLFIWLIYLIILYFIDGKEGVSFKSYLWRILGAGALSTYLIHTDERFIIHIFLIMLIIILFHSVRFRKRLLIAVSYGAFILLLSVPWAARNNVVFGRPIFLSYRTASYSDSLFSKLGYEWKEIVAPINTSHIYGSISISEAAIDSIAAGLSPSSVRLRAEENIRLGLDNGVRPHGFSTMRRYLSNFSEFFKLVDLDNDFRASGYKFSKEWPLHQNVASLLSWGIFIPGFIVALLIAYRNRIIIFMFLLIAMHASFHIFIAYVVYRYRTPVTPFVILGGVYGYWLLHTMWRQKSVEKLSTEGVEL
ncbi:MAG: hypothetical protein K8R90_01520 [Candidatus Cloacimonetes bacterium]|nr:hypothetical protein [Candidatus Cloacimonadota bacterium]